MAHSALPLFSVNTGVNQSHADLSADCHSAGQADHFQDVLVGCLLAWYA